MQRVTRSTKAVAKPAVPAGEGAGGFFTGGDPAGGIPATQPGYEWFNRVQEELVNAIEGAGLVLDAADDTQLIDAITALITAGAANAAYLNVLQSWSKPQIAATSDLGNITGTVTPDLATAQNFLGTTTGNITLANPSNIAGAVGQKGSFTIDNAGGHVLSGIGTYWKRVAGSGAPTLPTGRCRIDFHVISATLIDYAFGSVEA